MITRVICLAWIAVIAAAPSILLGQRTPETPGPYTDREASADMLAFERDCWLDGYKSLGHRDPAWDAGAIEFLDQFCRYRAFRDVWKPLIPPDFPTPESLNEKGSSLQKCDDPQVGYARAVILIDLGQDQNAVKILRGVLPKLNDGKHLPQAVVAVADLLRTYDIYPRAGEMKGVNESLQSNAILMARGFEPTRAQRYVRFLILRDALNHRPAIETAVCDAVRKSPDADQWLINVLDGERETHKAWEARGSGLGNSVSPDGWKGFNAHLAKAREYLTAAWEFDRTLPGAADAMLSVAIGEGPQRNLSLRHWFGRALDAKADDRLARDGLLWGYLPRWGGSHEELLTIAEMFAKDTHFDTQVPYWFFDAIQWIASDSGDIDGQIWSDAHVYSLAQHVFDGYVKSLPKGPGQDWVVSFRAAIAGRAGHFDEARALLDGLGNHLVRAQFSDALGDADLPISSVYVHTGKLAAPTAAADAQAQAMQYAPAGRQYHQLLATLPDSDPAAHYLNAAAARMEFLEQYASGQWATIQFPKQFSLFHPRQGQWKVDDKGRLTGVGTGAGLAISFLPDLGDAYEVTATLEYQNPPNRPSACGIYLDSNGKTWANGLFYSTRFNNVIWYANQQQGRKPVQLQSTNQLHLQFIDKQFTGSFNGEKLPIAQPRKDPALGDPTCRLTIASLYQDQPTVLTVSDLKIRRIR